MRALGVLRWYHVSSRAWMSAAALSLLLPASVRLDFWLPLHLALAGAVSVAIAGSMQTFAGALTAAPTPPRARSLTLLLSINLAAGLVAAGVTSHTDWIVAAGGALFALAIFTLAELVSWQWRRGLNRRFRVVFVLYGASLASIVAGAVLGALMGARAIGPGITYEAIREAHMTLNVLGWASLTIAGTLITFLPTVLRVRIPQWSPIPTAVALIGAVAALAIGRGLRIRAIAMIGAMLLALGAGGLTWFAIGALRTHRRHFMSVSAMHLICAIAWFDGGAVALAIVAVRGGALESTFIVTFALGWVVQTLLGAWLYLLPAQHEGGPAERKLLLAGVELGRWPQIVGMNSGLAILAIGTRLPLSHAATLAGAGVALAGATLALVKAWSFAWLATLRITQRRAEALWSQTR